MKRRRAQRINLSASEKNSGPPTWPGFRIDGAQYQDTGGAFCEGVLALSGRRPA
jgi:hypothetical protein